MRNLSRNGRKKVFKDIFRIQLNIYGEAFKESS